MKKDDLFRMQKMVDLLNEASDAYYNSSYEIMSNFEWDCLYYELDTLERRTGVVLPNSPTHHNRHNNDSPFQKNENLSSQETYPSFGQSRAGLKPYSLEEWGISFIEYNRLADAIEQGFVPLFLVGSLTISDFKEGRVTVDHFLEAKMGAEKYNSLFKTSFQPIRNAISQAEFEKIARSVLANFNNDQIKSYNIEGSGVFVEVFSKRRHIPWTIKLSFDDEGQITGRFECVFATYPTSGWIGTIGNLISNKIHSAKYMSCLE